MGNNKKRGEEFASLVHQILIIDRRYDIKIVASRCGMTYDTLYARLSNRVTFSAEEVRLLICAAPDPRFAGYLLSGSQFIPAERVDEEEMEDDPLESIRRTAMKMMTEAADVANAIEDAIGDNRIDHREAAVIHEEIDTAERAVATVREHVRQFAKKGGPEGGSRKTTSEYE